MFRRVLCAFACVLCILLSACNTDPGPYMLSGVVARSDAGIPDNCLVALYEADSVNMTTSLPAPLYSTTISFASSSASYSIDSVPRGTYYLGAFLGVNDGTNVSSSEAGYGATDTYVNPFPLVEVNIVKDTVINIEETDWVDFDF